MSTSAFTSSWLQLLAALFQAVAERLFSPKPVLLLESHESKAAPETERWGAPPYDGWGTPPWEERDDSYWEEKEDMDAYWDWHAPTSDWVANGVAANHDWDYLDQFAPVTPTWPSLDLP
jgi:hypothetical protein